MILNCSLLVVVVALTAALSPGKSFAQEVLSVHPGARVRLLAPPQLTKPTVARISAVHLDTLIVFPDGHLRPMVVPFSAVRELEASRYRKSMANQGAVIGASLGGITMTIVGLSRFEDDCPNTCPPSGWPQHLRYDCSDYVCFGFSKTQNIFIASFASVAVGGGIGYLIGRLIKVERWQKVSIEKIQVGLDRTNQAVIALGFSLNF